MSSVTKIRPQLKHTSPVYGSDEIIYIGGYGTVTEIADPDGSVRRLLGLLDGTRTAEGVHAALAAEYPHITFDEVATAIEQFDGAGFLIDAAITADGILTQYDLDRWQRNINFFGSYSRLGDNKYERQRRLRDCRITLLGLGGLGTHLLMDLAAMGVGHIRVVEFDRVELSNLNRQILYRESDIGKPKIELAVARVREFAPRLDIEAVTRKISSADDVAELSAGADVVVCVADRPKMEIINWVNEGCVRTGTALVTGGLDTQRVIYYVVLPGQTGCIECWKRQVMRDDTVSRALIEEKRARQIGGDNAAFCPLVTATAALMLAEVTRIVTGIAPPIAAGRLMELFFDDFVLHEYERWDRQDDCPVCGVHARHSQPADVPVAA